MRDQLNLLAVETPTPPAIRREEPRFLPAGIATPCHGISTNELCDLIKLKGGEEIVRLDQTGARWWFCYDEDFGTIDTINPQGDYWRWNKFELMSLLSDYTWRRED